MRLRAGRQKQLQDVSKDQEILNRRAGRLTGKQAVQSLSFEKIS